MWYFTVCIKQDYIINVRNLDTNDSPQVYIPNWHYASDYEIISSFKRDANCGFQGQIHTNMTSSHFYALE